MNKKINNKTMFLMILVVLILLIVTLVSLNLLNNLKGNSSLKGELGTTSPTASTYPTTSSTYTPTSSTYTSSSSVPPSTTPSTSGCITDQYIISGSSSMSDEAFDGSFSNYYNGQINMNFKYNNVEGWVGSGTITEYSGSSSNSPRSSEDWTETTTITCMRGKCKSNFVQDGTFLYSGREPVHHTSSTEIASPRDNDGISTGSSQDCSCSGSTYVKTPLTNCPTVQIFPGGDWVLGIFNEKGSADCTENSARRGSSCSYYFAFSHKDGFCCDKNGDCNMDTDDFTCDFNAEDYISGGIASDGLPYLVKPEDSCNNIDTDGKIFAPSNIKTNDACCPATLGAKEKYVVNKGEKTIVANTDSLAIQACSQFKDQNSCNDALTDCNWDLTGRGCIPLPLAICKDTGADKCVECTSSTAEKDCGAGKKCCNGKCYDPATQVCCGVTSGDVGSITFVDCREMSSRTEWPVESGGVCYKPGENVEAFNKLSVPGNYETALCDNFKCLAGDLTNQIYIDAKSGCDHALSSSGSTSLTESLGPYSWKRDYPNKATCIVNQFPNFVTTSFSFGPENTLKASVIGGYKWETEFIYRTIITGYKKTSQAGRGRGGGRGDDVPSDEPIKENVRFNSVKFNPMAGFGVTYDSYDWTYSVNVLSDMEKGACNFGVLWKPSNGNIFGCLDLTCFQDGKWFIGAELACPF